MFFRFYWTSPSEQAASPWERALGRLPSHFDRTLYNRSLCFAGVETYLTGSEKLWQPVIQVMPQRARHSDHGLRFFRPVAAPKPPTANRWSALRRGKKRLKCLICLPLCCPLCYAETAMKYQV